MDRLVDMKIYLATQEQSFCGHDKASDSENKGNYKELAELLSIYDPKFDEFLKESSVFRGMSKTIQNDLLDQSRRSSKN